MMSNFPIVPLGDLVKVKGGKRLPKGSSLQVEGNSHPYIRVRDMGERYIPNVGLEYVPDDVFPKIQRYIVEENDVIISIVGTIGLISVIDKKFNLASQTENCAKLSGLDKVDALYLYYYLISSAGQQEIKEATVGAVQAKLPLYNIEKIPVSWPDKNTRELIVANLGGIDNKIELNRQTNLTLEQMAQAIFKSWFVDFEPTRAKAQARAQIAKGIMPSGHVFVDASNLGEDAQTANAQQPLPKNFSQADADQLVERAAMAAISGKSLSELDKLPAETLEQLKTTAALFPETLVDSELGEIPEGWGLGELKNIAEFSTDRVNASVLTLENYISTENMLEGKKGISRASSLPTVKTVPSFKPGQILISNIRPYFMKIWLARFEGGRSNDVLGINAKEPEGVEYLYNLLYQDVFFNFMMTTSKGAKMPRGDKEAIMGWVCVQPCVDIKKEYSEAVGDFYKVVDSNNKENMSLEETRNALLPKLLSGEIEVDNAA